MKSEASGKAAQIDQQDVERLILDAAGAALRLVVERDALRSRVDTLECEVILLRQQNTLIHSYRRLTSEFVTKVQLFDSEFRDSFREPTESKGTRLAGCKKRKAAAEA